MPARAKSAGSFRSRNASLFRSLAAVSRPNGALACAGAAQGAGPQSRPASVAVPLERAELTVSP